ncbi:unnamed protein product, partial [Cladocopium goreaui]
ILAAMAPACEATATPAVLMACTGATDVTKCLTSAQYDAIVAAVRGQLESLSATCTASDCPQAPVASWCVVDAMGAVDVYFGVQLGPACSLCMYPASPNQADWAGCVLRMAGHDFMAKAKAAVKAPPQAPPAAERAQRPTGFAKILRDAAPSAMTFSAVPDVLYGSQLLSLLDVLSEEWQTRLRSGVFYIDPAVLVLLCHCAMSDPRPNWNAAMTYAIDADGEDFANGQGGSDACTDMEDPENAGLPECLASGEHGKSLQEVYNQYCLDVSLADFLVIAAEAVIASTRARYEDASPGAPHLDLRAAFKFGRQTASSCDFAVGRLPNPERGCDAEPWL